MPVMMNPIIIFLTCSSVCLIIMWSECVWVLLKGSKFHSLRWPQQEEEIDPIETFLDFEVAHLSVLYFWFGDCHNGATDQKLQFLKFVGGIVKRYFLSLQIFHPLYILLGRPPPQNLRSRLHHFTSAHHHTQVCHW